MEDKKWGAEERDLLYQVMCCFLFAHSYSDSAIHYVASLLPMDAFSARSKANARL